MSWKDHPVAVATLSIVGTTIVTCTIMFTAVIPTWLKEKDNEIAALKTERTRLTNELDDVRGQLPISPAQTMNLSIGSATATRPAETGNIEMTIQQFVRRYLELDGRYAEQKAYLSRANRKRVRWRVLFMFPASNFTGVTAYFDVPAESRSEPMLHGSPVRWANFPQNFRDRLYSLKPGDLIEITGVLHAVNRNTVTIDADDFDVVTMPTPTPAPKSKKSH